MNTTKKDTLKFRSLVRSLVRSLIRPLWICWICAIFFFALTSPGAAHNLGVAKDAWRNHVPASDRTRVNPVARQPEAIAAGKLLYRDHCAQCHGVEATGRHNHPSLRTERVALATDGELAWLLKNGNTWKGMPSWSSLPEQQRWQILAFLRSLPAPAMQPVPQKLCHPDRS